MWRRAQLHSVLRYIQPHHPIPTVLSISDLHHKSYREIGFRSLNLWVRKPSQQPRQRWYATADAGMLWDPLSWQKESHNVLANQGGLKPLLSFDGRVPSTRWRALRGQGGSEQPFGERERPLSGSNTVQRTISSWSLIGRALFGLPSSQR
jgi:hypothetical protein